MERKRRDEMERNDDNGSWRNKSTMDKEVNEEGKKKR